MKLTIPKNANLRFTTEQTKNLINPEWEMKDFCLFLIRQGVLCDDLTLNKKFFKVSEFETRFGTEGGNGLDQTIYGTALIVTTEGIAFLQNQYAAELFYEVEPTTDK